MNAAFVMYKPVLGEYGEVADVYIGDIWRKESINNIPEYSDHNDGIVMGMCTSDGMIVKPFVYPVENKLIFSEKDYREAFGLLRWKYLMF